MTPLSYPRWTNRGENNRHGDEEAAHGTLSGLLPSKTHTAQKWPQQRAELLTAGAGDEYIRSISHFKQLGRGFSP